MGKMVVGYNILEFIGNIHISLDRWDVRKWVRTGFAMRLERAWHTSIFQVYTRKNIGKSNWYWFVAWEWEFRKISVKTPWNFAATNRLSLQRAPISATVCLILLENLTSIAWWCRYTIAWSCRYTIAWSCQYKLYISCQYTLAWNVSPSMSVQGTAMIVVLIHVIRVAKLRAWGWNSETSI